MKYSLHKNVLFTIALKIKNVIKYNYIILILNPVSCKGPPRPWHTLAMSYPEYGMVCYDLDFVCWDDVAADTGLDFVGELLLGINSSNSYCYYHYLTSLWRFGTVLYEFI